MNELFQKFRAFPLTVRMAMVFLTIFILLAGITIPEITLPFLLIVGVIASLMRIFIFMVERK